MKVVHRLYARLFGYFWAPCPLCGKHFGGHQWKDRRGMTASIRVLGRAMVTTENGALVQQLSAPMLKAICPKCTKAGLGTA